jgi:hypothetical protein
MTTEQRTPEQRTARQETMPTWYGYLADENVQHIADRIRNLLAGRRYTFASINASHAHFTGPEVRTSQELRPEHTDSKTTPTVYRFGEPMTFSPGRWKSCGITVADTYGAWGIHSSHATQADAYADRDAEKKTWTYVTIEGGRTPEDVSRKGIQIQQFNGPGEILHWTITPEQPARSLEEAVYDLERLQRIGKSRRDRVSDRDWEWFSSHPLTRRSLKPFNDAVPTLIDWLRGGAQ